MDKNLMNICHCKKDILLKLEDIKS